MSISSHLEVPTLQRARVSHHRCRLRDNESSLLRQRPPYPRSVVISNKATHKTFKTYLHSITRQMMHLQLPYPILIRCLRSTPWLEAMNTRDRKTTSGSAKPLNSRNAIPTQAWLPIHVREVPLNAIVPCPKMGTPQQITGRGQYIQYDTRHSSFASKTSYLSSSSIQYEDAYKEDMLSQDYNGTHYTS